MKKLLRFLAVCAVILSCISTRPIFAAVPIAPQPPIATTAPDIIATSIVAGAQLENIELFNQSDIPLNLADWQIAATSKGTETCTTPQTATQRIAAQWILPKHYFTLTSTQPLPAACTKLVSIQILHDETPVQQISIADTTILTTDKVYQHKQRANSPTSVRSASGTFEADYTKVIAANQATLYSDPLYAPPASNGGLQILEILPHARDCAPTDNDLACSDYIKVYNSTNTSVDLASYRLRTGHKSQSESISNTFTWGHSLNPPMDELSLPAHSYFTLNTRNDGQALSITDSGGFVWLEDIYGTIAYEPIVAYPDAASTTKIGKSWAFNGTSWQWSAAPQPNQPNYFPPEIAMSGSTVAVESSLKPCAENQYRSPETNRCRNVATTASTTTPCKAGQERNPDTNRCRSVLASSTEPKPCQSGEERNPETNRCRKIPATANGYVKGTSDKNDTANHFTWIVALAAAIAVGYAGYEWRHDIALGFSRIKGKLAALVTRSKD